MDLGGEQSSWLPSCAQTLPVNQRLETALLTSPIGPTVVASPSPSPLLSTRPLAQSEICVSHSSMRQVLFSVCLVGERTEIGKGQSLVLKCGPERTSVSHLII